ncbi:MAG: lysophospholipid acyltransferase family protein [Candidatus Acidiferrales bacterium]
MKKTYLALRCLVLWVISALHFFPVCTFLVLLGLVIDPRKNDWPQRVFFRNIIRLAGAGFQVRRAPGFDPQRTSIFICNHVNLFDPFVIYSAIPQFVRGWELETHFTIPAYGWMMGRFGNIPVPENTASLATFKALLRRTQAALDAGISVIVFPEGSRTRDGRVGPFQEGIFRMLPHLQYPVVPMSIVGALEWFRTGDWMLNPATVTVDLHDTLETRGMTRSDVEAFQQRVYETVARPIDAALERRGTPE